MMIKVLMSRGRSWVSVKNCPDSHLELPTVTHSNRQEAIIKLFKFKMFIQKLNGECKSHFYMVGMKSKQLITRPKYPSSPVVLSVMESPALASRVTSLPPVERTRLLSL